MAVALSAVYDYGPSPWNDPMVSIVDNFLASGSLRQRLCCLRMLLLLQRTLGSNSIHQNIRRSNVVFCVRCQDKTRSQTRSANMNRFVSVMCLCCLYFQIQVYLVFRDVAKYCRLCEQCYQMHNNDVDKDVLALSPGHRRIPANTLPSPPKSTRNIPKTGLLDFGKKQIVLVRQLFIVPLNNTMLTSTERVSSIILEETSTFGDLSEPHIVKTTEAHR